MKLTKTANPRTDPKIVPIIAPWGFGVESEEWKDDAVKGDVEDDVKIDVEDDMEADIKDDMEDGVEDDVEDNARDDFEEIVGDDMEEDVENNWITEELWGTPIISWGGVNVVVDENPLGGAKSSHSYRKDENK